jgi:peroxiredoxin
MGYRIDKAGRIVSELAVGADPLLKLATMDASQLQKTHPIRKETPSPAKHSDPSLAHSRLNRSGLKPGTIAPDFRLPRIDEGELSLSEFRGRCVLLVFSDPNCGPCDELAPKLEELRQKRPDLQVLMISRRDAEATRAKAAALGLSFPIVMQNQWEISLKYAMFATPIGYLIDKQGDILKDVAVGVGPILALAEEPVLSPTEAVETSLMTVSQS